ncbi:MAG TPA: histidine kinase [Bacteroidales bacterium]|nr:MAG: hypothetical protein A2W98_07870 [Bacteroidetes bacterium GWF2_33_38]OFY92257.1 MAG: hypothetical protein A2236_09125 [Bacteroidetes bacterium RIFOXYA2_FULL_33_7]HBF87317.1 histidine kinase [Bacteroidales bacterium]
MIKLTDKELLAELEKRFEINQKALEELREMTEKLKFVNKKLEDSEALKSHFLSNIRNEIINPFASIMALSKNIMTLKSENFEKGKDMAKHILTEAFILDFQLNNIFAAAEIEAGIIAPQITNTDIKLVIKNVIETFNTYANQRKITLEHICNIQENTPSVFFKTDFSKIQLILSNLLSNAITYSSENQKVITSISLNNKVLRISIKDFGKGINEESQYLIFDRFKKLDDRIYTLNAGPGLGLSIVREFVEILQGEIVLNSKINEGSEFILTIPESEISDFGFSEEGDTELF